MLRQRSDEIRETAIHPSTCLEFRFDQRSWFALFGRHVPKERTTRNINVNASIPLHDFKHQPETSARTLSPSNCLLSNRSGLRSAELKRRMEVLALLLVVAHEFLA